MKVLILTDIPPCKNLTAGLVLDQLCRFLPRGSVVCFAVTNPEINPKLSPDLDWIPIEYERKPRESSVMWPARSRRIRQLLTAIREEWNSRVVVPRLIRRAVAFGRLHKVDTVWAVLQGQTIVRMALPLAEALGAPLHTHVWDPLSWWLVAHEVDPRTSRLALAQFDRTLRQSRSCAAASWAMADHYRERYGTDSVPLISSHDRTLAQDPPPRLNADGEIVIGMAGQFYAVQEWHQLIEALKAAGWKVSGRSVRLKVFGHYVPVSDVPEGRLEFLGWRPQSEVIQILSQVDLLYCPYPFARHLEEVSRLSFPSKVVTYLAAGRPILFHGPAYSSPARYLGDAKAALLATSFDAPAIYNEIQRVVDDPALYETVALNGRARFLADFTLERMRECLWLFLQTSEAELSAQYESYVPAVAPERGSRLARYAPYWAGPRRALRQFALKVPAIRNLYRRAEDLEAALDRLGHELHQVYAYSGKLEAQRDQLGAELHQLYAYAGRVTEEQAVLQARIAELEGLGIERDAPGDRPNPLEIDRERLRADPNRQLG